MSVKSVDTPTAPIAPSEEERNALAILSHLPKSEVDRLKALLKFDSAASFLDRMEERDFDLSDAGVNAFKTLHHLGNAGSDHGRIGPQTAATYAAQLRTLPPDFIINDEGLNLLKGFEGLERQVKGDPGYVHAYPDQIGVWTIGYGHTAGVKPGDRITVERAGELLREDLREAAKAVRAFTGGVTLTENEFSALVSFTFNVGAGNFQRSTLLRNLKAGDHAGAADQFLRFVYAGGKPLPGLLARRKKERALFLKP